MVRGGKEKGVILKEARKTTVCTRQGRNSDDIAEDASERMALNTFVTFLCKFFFNR